MPVVASIVRTCRLHPSQPYRPCLQPAEDSVCAWGTHRESGGGIDTPPCLCVGWGGRVGHPTVLLCCEISNRSAAPLLIAACFLERPALLLPRGSPIESETLPDPPTGGPREVRPSKTPQPKARPGSEPRSLRCFAAACRPLPLRAPPCGTYHVGWDATPAVAWGADSLIERLALALGRGGDPPPRLALGRVVVFCGL